MPQRPPIITGIGWFLTLLGVVSITSTAMTYNDPTVLQYMSRNPMPIPLQYAISFVGLLIMTVSGLGMLRGYNWSRYLYIVWNLIGFAISFATVPARSAMVPSLILFGFVTFVMVGPKAQAYFSARPYSPATNGTPGRSRT